MRLTLRTLLAYLDDILEPSEAKEIGKKLQESPVATALVSRIREVMRRRRLGAPDLEGPGVGIDPNLVAQYLDNTLLPEQVAEVEKICLESDLQLAEMAACHQILTLSLGEPVEISTHNRERLYVLGPVDASEKLQAGEPAFRNNGASAMKTPLSVRTIPGSAGPSFEESLPDYLRQKPWSGKMIPIAAGVILLLVWLGAVVSDQNLMEGLMGLRNVPAPKPNYATTHEVKPEGELIAGGPANVAAPETKPDVTPPVTKTTKPPRTEVAKVDDSPADAVPEQPAEEPAEPPAPPVPMPEETAPKKAVTVSVQLVSPEGILLRWDAIEKSWYVVPRQADLKPGTVIACPEPFEAILEIDHGAMRATILGETVLEILPADDAAPVTFRLHSGRLILQTSRRDDQPHALGFQIGPRAGVLEFGEGDTLAGIEFLYKEPVAFQQPPPLAERMEGLYMLSGSVRWLPNEEQARVANKGVYLKLLTDQLPLNFGSPGGTTPDWLDPQRRKATSPLRRFAKQYEKEFELNQPIDPSMRALIRDPRPKVSELAVRCLALTDNYAAVVQAMAQVEHEDARKAAINGLRLWLGAREGRGVLLRQTLATIYERDDQIDALDRLLWGISETEARAQQTSVELVEWLRSDKVEIRELAFANLVRLTGRKYDYRPLASAAQREPAIKRWFEHLQREGAIVRPE